MKVFYKTVGCRVNQVETESLREKFSALGHTEAASPEEADLVLLNSCSVTARADRDCLAFLRRAAAANPKASMAVTGCLATLEPGRILAAVPGAAVFRNKDKESIPASFCGVPAPADFFPVAAFRGKSRAFVKVQEGCNLKCSYCLVNLARPELSSKPLAAALAEVKGLVSSGFSEIVLCGTHLGAYRCPASGAGLDGLTEALFALEGDFRLRFSSIEPGEVTQRLLRALKAGGDRFCDYFHLPLQSGSDLVLKAMRRPYDKAAYRRRTEELRSFFPGAGIYADVIAGYPSETGEDFEMGLEFIKDCALSGLHVFSFSARPGTPAAALKPLPPSVVSARSEALRSLDAGLRAAYAASLAGRELRALVLKNSGGRALALASNFVDLELPGPLKPGRLLRCRVTGARSGVCFAEPL